MTKEEAITYARDYYYKNRSTILAKKREYHRKNQETRNAKERVYRAENPEKIRSFNQSYYKKNSEGLKAKQLLRAAGYRTAGKYSHLQKKWSLKKRYGLSIEQYTKLLVAQNNLCAICLVKPKKSSLAVDHDHKTGKVRGLLCIKCNMALGALDDNTELLFSAARYLGIHVDFPSHELNYWNNAPLKDKSN